MIYKIYANDSRFKSVDFEPGLNLVIADKELDSTKKHTRNGAGKTTLIKVMHFCLGGALSKLSLPVEEIKSWVFTIEMDLVDCRYAISRSIEEPNKILISGEIDKLPVKPDQDNGAFYYKNDEWKQLLGICLFDLKGKFESAYKPSFRSLISYFIRQNADAYSNPFRHFRSQKTFDWQINNAFLLGLNWEHASSAQEIKDKEKVITSLNDAVKLGLVSTQGELEAEKVRLESELKNEQENIATFKVHPKYKEIQEESNYLTSEIQKLSNENIILLRKLNRYEESIKSEKPPASSSVEKLYEEAGVSFPDSLKRTLQEARIFHSEIIKNRKNFLDTEIEVVKLQIINNDEKIEELSDKKSHSMKILQTHGALDEYNSLQEIHVEKKSQLEDIKHKITSIKNISHKKKEIKSDKIKLESVIQRDYEECRISWEKSVAIFNKNSQALYNTPGSLIINTSDKGYSFDVEIKRSSSEGIGKMKIFCYDLTLLALFSARKKIDFLVHDSTMFDGVDSRQVALALELAHKETLQSNSQYICMFNSDALPKDDFSKDFNIYDFVRLTLKDKNSDDGLFGFEFDVDSKKSTHKKSVSEAA